MVIRQGDWGSGALRYEGVEELRFMDTTCVCVPLRK